MSIVAVNKIKVYFFMIILTLIIGLLGSFLSYSFGWGLSGTGFFLVIAGIVDFVAYWFSDRILLHTSKAISVSPEQAPEYYAIMRGLSTTSGIPMPRLYIIDADEMNAFATGRNQKHSAIAATRGLLEKLTKAEIRAVLAHEVSHVKNYDMAVMAVVAVLAGTVSILADTYYRSTLISHVQSKDRSGITALLGAILAVAAPITTMLVQLAISRKREIIADINGSQLIGETKSLASALRKIALDRRPLPVASAATAHVFFFDPLKASSFIERVFSTHPPVSERIRLLESL